jgi:hypothetical protein
VTLDGAAQGLAYYMKPDLSRLSDSRVWIDAATQVNVNYPATQVSINYHTTQVHINYPAREVKYVNYPAINYPATQCHVYYPDIQELVYC